MVRAKKSEDFLKVNVAARIDPVLRTQIVKLAAAKRWSVSQYIEIALTEHVDGLQHEEQAKRGQKKKTP